MSDKVSLHGAIGAALAAHRTQPVNSRPISVTSLKTNHEAEKVLRDTLKGMGLDDPGISWFLRQKTLARGQLMSKPDGPVTKETRQFTRMLLDLRGNPHATNNHKLRFAARCAGMKPGRGRREVLANLAQKPAFWKSLGTKHRDIIYYQLQRAGSAPATKKLGQAFGALIDHALFSRASGQGKKNALSQPHRSHKLLTSYDRSKVKLPLDTSRANKDIWTYARRYSGLKLPRKQKSLYRSMVNLRTRVLGRFFENVPTYKKVADRSVWFGEKYRQNATFSWEQTLDTYLEERRKQERCRAIHGGGKRCLQ